LKPKEITMTQPRFLPVQLPAPPVKRWTPGKKLAVVEAFRLNELTAEEAYRRYEITQAELSEWQVAVERHGKGGLKASLVDTRRRARPLRLIVG
jgi:hypothetical protein